MPCGPPGTGKAPGNIWRREAGVPGVLAQPLAGLPARRRRPGGLLLPLHPGAVGAYSFEGMKVPWLLKRSRVGMIHGSEDFKVLRSPSALF